MYKLRLKSFSDHSPKILPFPKAVVSVTNGRPFQTHAGSSDEHQSVGRGLDDSSFHCSGGLIRSIQRAGEPSG